MDSSSEPAVDLARLQLSYATIRAPITGIVGARLVFPGSSVKINDTTLAVVNRPRPLLVAFSVPERHLARLRSAMKDGGMKVDVGLPNDKSQTFEGSVTFLDNTVDPATGTILMKAELPNKDLTTNCWDNKEYMQSYGKSIKPQPPGKSERRR